MFDAFNEEKRNVNQLYLSHNHTITELYKTDSYVEQLKAIVKKLNDLLELHEKVSKDAAEIKNARQYAELVNQIAVEYQYLLATSKAMNDNLDNLKKSCEFQGKISGELLSLKKQVSKAIEEAREVLGGAIR